MGTVAELHDGTAKSDQPDIATANIRRILKTLVVVPFDEAAAEAYGIIRASLEKRGASIGPLDTLIASHALSLGWTLVTDNTREFKRVAGLHVEDWLAPLSSSDYRCLSSRTAWARGPGVSPVHVSGPLAPAWPLAPPAMDAPALTPSALPRQEAALTIRPSCSWTIHVMATRWIGALRHTPRRSARSRLL